MIDVSSYQGVIDWGKVFDSGQRHAYVKWGEWWNGSYHVDVQAKRNLRECRKHGVGVGVYFFAHPSRSPVESARWFLRSTAGELHPGDLPPALDLEVSEGHTWPYLNDWKAQWFAAVDDAIGCRAVFYSYWYFWKQMQLYADRPVWGAALGKAFVPPASWAIHQYSFTGTVPGIAGHVDMDKILHDIPSIPIRGGV